MSQLSKAQISPSFIIHHNHNHLPKTFSHTVA
jgi:hypothetical protein